MTTNLTPWQAEPDTFAISRPAKEFMAAFTKAANELSFVSENADCEFFAEVSSTDANLGPAIVITDMAEYQGRSPQTAVVVSAVVYADHHDDRQVVIRTHLEGQRTRYEGGHIVFDAHHQAMRAALSEAVLEVEPLAEHRHRPTEPDQAAEPTGQTVGPQRVRPQPQVVATPVEPRLDLRQAAGMSLLVVGVVVLLVAITFGSLYPIVGATGVAAMLGYVGNRIAGG